MGVSLDTVRFHVRHLYGKLEVHSKPEAVAEAQRRGLIARSRG
jgi:DNA-binding CsgD family transcriptional regulator